MSLFSVFAIAGSGMSAETQWLNTIASNIANANSASNSSGQPYRAREVVFQATPLDGSDGSNSSDGTSVSTAGMSGVRIAGVVQSQQPLHEVYDPSSPYANGNGYVQMPNVNPVDEMVNMIAATRNYQANLDAFNVAKTLALKTLTI